MPGAGRSGGGTGRPAAQAGRVTKRAGAAGAVDRADDGEPNAGGVPRADADGGGAAPAGGGGQESAAWPAREVDLHAGQCARAGMGLARGDGSARGGSGAVCEAIGAGGGDGVGAVRDPFQLGNTIGGGGAVEAVVRVGALSRRVIKVATLKK